MEVVLIFWYFTKFFIFKLFCEFLRYKRKLEELLDDDEIEPAQKYSRLLEVGIKNHM